METTLPEGLDGMNITDFLQSTPLFKEVSSDILRPLANKMQKVELSPDQFLFRQGDISDTFYVVQSGQLTVFSELKGTSQTLTSFRPGQCVGEMAMFFSGHRNVSVKAVTHCVLLKIDKYLFQKAVNEQLSVRRLLGKLLEERLPTLRKATTDLFGDVEDDLLLEIESQFTWQKLKRGETLFRQGDPGASIYLVINGRLQLSVKKVDGREEIVADLGRGEWVGEIALILNEPRSGTVFSVRDTEVVALTKEDFDAIIQRHPSSLIPIVQTLARRLKVTTSGNRPQYSKQTLAMTIVVIPLSEDIPDLPPPILDELGAEGSLLLIDSEEFEHIHGRGSASTDFNLPGSIYLNEWQFQQEEYHKYIIYQADFMPSTWTKRCLRHADKILLVAHHNHQADLTNVEKMIAKLDIKIPIELVLLHAPDTKKISGTKVWLDCRDVLRYHHIRIGNLADSQRVGRLLTQRATGMVLSGGGARGFAHIGVLKALSEHGIDIDIIAGTSMGAYIAALFAQGNTHGEIVHQARQIFLEKPKGISYTLPYTSLMKISKSEVRLKEMMNDIYIEDLNINFFCISASLVYSTMHIHRQGLLWRALRASTALPGIFPPVFEDDDILVDGGLINVLPIDVMDKQEMKHVIASDVTRPGALQVSDFNCEYANLPDVVLNRMNPFSENVQAPHAGEIMMVSMHLTSIMKKRQNMRLADLYLVPPVSNYPLLEMEQFDNLIIEGYNYTRNRLEKDQFNITDIQPKSP